MRSVVAIYRSDHPANAASKGVKDPGMKEKSVSERRKPILAAKAKRESSESCIFFENLLSRKMAARERETGT